MREEGWYVDPYGLHDRRWFSDGTPTKLVRDGDLESSDPPPDRPFEGRPEPFQVGSDGGDEIGGGPRRRAAKPEDPGVVGAWEAFVETGGD
jgi:hypothetical protein